MLQIISAQKVFFKKLNKEQKIKMLKIAQKWATRQIIKPDFEIKQMKKKN